MCSSFYNTKLNYKQYYIEEYLTNENNLLALHLNFDFLKNIIILQKLVLLFHNALDKNMNK